MTTQQKSRARTQALSVLYFALVQLAVGTTATRTYMNAQSAPVDLVVERLATRQAGIDTRLTHVEGLRVPERLAVLERAADDARETRRLMYGVIITLLGSVVAQIIQIRATWKRVDDDA